MAEIKILPEILSNKIAAGEVIERPASVVKELVENALDAGSTRIILALENAGKSMIRISDNGKGMGRDDALMAIERYATSKLASDEDLFAIDTLGFRGEALPSIASVSRLSIETRDNRSDVGVRIDLDGGRIKSVTDIGAPTGTQVTVKQLFFNTPARRKYLKTTGTEMGHIVDTLSGIALAWPTVHFQLLHNHKTVKNWPAAEAPPQRIADVIGNATKNNLLPIEASQHDVSIKGWITTDKTLRSTTRGIYTFVNQRFVKDRLVQHALLAGYAGRIVSGRYPVAVLFLSVAFDRVDVNVHPTKHAVRFADPNRVHGLIETTVAEALLRATRPTWSIPSDTDASVSESMPIHPPAPTSDAYRKSEPVHPDPMALPSEAPPLRPLVSEPTPKSEPTEAPAKQVPIWQPRTFQDLRIIGQFHDTYIVCESTTKGLILIDQHAAHERIVYEQLQQRKQEKRTESQNLLLPETLELGFREAQTLAQMLPDLAAFGLTVEPFGGTTFVIKSVPTLLSDQGIGSLISEIVEKMVAVTYSPGLETALDEVRRLMACHGSIRANQRLSLDQIKALLEQLDACESPSHCPHGRPTWIQWRLAEIEKSFRRVL
ncbi:MAG: DNA mismatch repair endonuclease MutL [Deltaproteobacteria bacterium]|nr:DNA mismatch repair endonuclease MutL [Deltaproteobacteria bacterium]